MAPADLAGLLLETTLAGSAAVLLVLGLRRPLRTAFGATVAYAAWTLVPAAVIAVSLPAATVSVAAAPLAMTLNAVALPIAAAAVAAPFDAAPWLLAAWLAGAVVMGLRLGRQQRAFRRGLGRLRRREDGLQQAESVAGLPAALGLLRPAIVVPADFDTRYSREERELMHAHERSHIVRGDLQINALVAGLRSVFWFNPLLHYATRHFRHDQELACDQRVIARHPRGRRAYGEAMFKTQLASQPLPLGCHWAAFHKARSHPLKERIAMLKQPTPTAARWIGGGTLVLVLALGVGFAAWSAQPGREMAAASALSAGMLMMQVEMRIDGGKPQQHTMIGKPGEPFAMRGEHAGQQWEMHGTASPRGGMVVLATTLSRDGKLVGSPKLVVREGRKAAIEIGQKNAASGAFEGIALEMMVTAVAPGVPPPPLPLAPPAAMAPPPPVPLEAGTNAKTAMAPLPPLPPAPTSEAGIAPAAAQGSVTPKARVGDANHTPAPKYPAEALAQRIGGKMVLAIDIDATGKPIEVEVVQSEPAGVFDQATVDAAMQWRFQPEIKDGKPVSSRVRVPVEFRAKKR